MSGDEQDFRIGILEDKINRRLDVIEEKLVAMKRVQETNSTLLRLHIWDVIKEGGDHEREEETPASGRASG